MGFRDEDYDILLANNIVVKENVQLFTRDKLIRMAGNSIPVKMLEGIFLQIEKIEKILGET